MSTKVKVVNLSGEVTLSTAAEHRDRILHAFEERSIVLAALSQVEEIDLFGIQLLYAARRYAERIGARFDLTGDVPEIVAQRLYDGGFVPDMVHDARSLAERLHGFGGTIPDADEPEEPEEPVDA